MTCGFGTCPWGTVAPHTLDKDNAACSRRSGAAARPGVPPLAPRWGRPSPSPPFLSPQGQGPKGYKVRCWRATAGGDMLLWGCSLTLV